MALEERLIKEKDELLDPVIDVDVEKDLDNLKEFSWDSILDDDDNSDEDDNNTNL